MEKTYKKENWFFSMKETYKIKPKCFKDQSMAITNQGYLIPCCFCDHPKIMKSDRMKDLLKVSNINDYDKLEDIGKTVEWKNFYNDLKNNIPPVEVCVEICSIKQDGSKVKELRTDTFIDTKSKTTKLKRII